MTTESLARVAKALSIGGAVIALATFLIKAKVWEEPVGVLAYSIYPLIIFVPPILFASKEPTLARVIVLSGFALVPLVVIFSVVMARVARAVNEGAVALSIALLPATLFLVGAAVYSGLAAGRRKKPLNAPYN